MKEVHVLALPGVVGVTASLFGSMVGDLVADAGVTIDATEGFRCSGGGSAKTLVGAGACFSQGKIGAVFWVGAASGTLYHMSLGGLGYRAGATNCCVLEDIL